VTADQSARLTRDSDEAVTAALLRYRVMANVVGVLLIALIIVAVPLKYFAHTVPFLSFYAERTVTRKVRAGERV
jgi:hypothetical protein